MEIKITSQIRIPHKYNYDEKWIKLNDLKKWIDDNKYCVHEFGDGYLIDVEDLDRELNE